MLQYLNEKTIVWEEYQPWAGTHSGLIEMGPDGANMGIALIKGILQTCPQ